MSTAVETRWWHAKEGDEDKVVCTLCPRECHIPDGSRGFCFVRANVEGRLVLTTYGRSSGFCIDPIEKKPLNHFLPGTPVLSFGTAGCNLGCKFCQNWDISKSRQMDRVADEASPEAIIDAAEQAGCRSVAFTYNDPVIWAEYAIDIARVARRRNIKTVAVTAGYISPDARRDFYQWIDAANVDLKAFTETFYRKLTQTQLEPVLDTLRYLKHETDVWFEITNLMIPGENDDPQETMKMCRWIVDNLGDEVPVHFTAFHPDFKMMDKPKTPVETLIRARAQALEVGIKFAYVGNCHDVDRQSTWCPGCGERVIERDWYELGAYRMKANRCASCDTTVAGVFDTARGDWGRKRLPIRIQNRTANPAQAEKTMEADTHQAAAAATPRTAFTVDETAAILALARNVVDQSVQGLPIEARLPDAVEEAPAYGAFVTLKRASLLRACRGRFATMDDNRSANQFRLGTLLREVAKDTALSDPRFAAIMPRELDWLGLEVSIMHGGSQVEARGTDRVAAVEAGRHGLVIDHPNGRGLLLPQVATENGWDAETFLQQVCRKAGLAPDTWQADNAALMTFEAVVLAQPPRARELDARGLSAEATRQLVEAADATLRGDALETDLDDALTEIRDGELGVHLQSDGSLSAAALGANQSVLDLVRMTCDSLKKRIAAKKDPKAHSVAQLSLLWEPVRLRPEDYPQRHRALVGAAVLAEDGQDAWALIFPRQSGRQDKVLEALQSVRLTAGSWPGSKARLTAFTVTPFSPAAAPKKVAAAPSGTDDEPQTVRLAARAGQFYPGSAGPMTEAADKHLAAGDDDVPPGPYRAVMLPHAGWRYCGDTLGKTLRRVSVPETVVVIGPKHTPHGADWSIAPHRSWNIPGGEVAIATELADSLLAGVDRFRREPEAHRYEHGTEVLLPFLQRVNPAVRVLPVILGGVTRYEDLQQLGEALADIVSESESAPLLVISSDMNHFASEQENRRLDHLALDAMATGDPKHLHEVVVGNQVSMCGVCPAVAVMIALRKMNTKLEPEMVDYSNSAAATGDTSRVVGYAGVVLE